MAVLEAVPAPERSLEGITVEVVCARPRFVAEAAAEELVVPAPRVARALSPKVLIVFVCFVGETGRAIPDFTGDMLLVAELVGRDDP